MPHICEYLFGKAGEPYRKALTVTAAAVVAVKVIRLASRVYKVRSQQASLDALEKNIVHLFIFPRWSRSANFSTPCLRLEAFLRLNKIPYVAHFTMDTSCSPTERLPFIVYNGEVVADSEFAAQWLTKRFNLTINASLSEHDHAVGLAARRLVEGSWQYGTYRTINVDNSAAVVAVYAREFRIPRFVAAYFVRSMRKGTITMLNAVGHGDLTNEQYRSEMLRDLKALEALIGNSKSYLLGNAPSSYDANVYAGLVVPLVLSEVATPELAFLRSSAILTSYVDRMTALLFPDLASLTSPAALAQTVARYEF